MSRLDPGRPHTDEEKRLSQVLQDTRTRIVKLKGEMTHHEAFIRHAQETCDHDWRGQDDVHPHGTPRETFICTICRKEEVR
jgi:hypothetical protein